MARYYHTFPHTKRHDYRKLFTPADTAALAYVKDTAFRKFVNEWHTDIPELMGWTLEDFHRQYKKSGNFLQLSLPLA